MASSESIGNVQETPDEIQQVKSFTQHANKMSNIKHFLALAHVCEQTV